MTHTWEEIGQQPEVWREIAKDPTIEDGPVPGFIADLLARPELRIILTGAGSSAFVGELLAPALTGRLGRRVDAIPTTDLVTDPARLLAERLPTLLVSFARSGNSPESIAATDIADTYLDQVSHLLITCNADGTLATRHAARPGSAVLLTPARTNDRGFAMTSSFTGMALTGWLALGGRSADESFVQQEIEAIARAAEEIIGDVERVRQLARRDYRRVVYLGSGPLRGAARESSLKMLELTAGRVVSYYDSVLGFRHGPKSVLDEQTLVVVYASNDPYARRYDEDMITELRAGIGPDNVVVLQSGTTTERGRWALPTLTDVAEELIALPYLVVAQLLAHTMSQRQGLTPDNPFPGGEVNRVVRGVTIHPWTA